MDWAFKQLVYAWMWCVDNIPGVRSFSLAVSDFASRHPSITFFLVILALSAIGLVRYDGVTSRCPRCRRLWAGIVTASSSPEPSGSSFRQERPFVTRTTETSRMTSRYRCRHCDHLWSRTSSSTSSRRDFDPHNP